MGFFFTKFGDAIGHEDCIECCAFVDGSISTGMEGWSARKRQVHSRDSPVPNRIYIGDKEWKHLKFVLKSSPSLVEATAEILANYKQNSSLRGTL